MKCTVCKIHSVQQRIALRKRTMQQDASDIMAYMIISTALDIMAYIIIIFALDHWFDYVTISGKAISSICLDH